MINLRYVFDTNTTISALLFASSTPARAFYAAADQGEILLSETTFLELREVLARQKFDRYVTRTERERFLVKLLVFARLIEIDVEVRDCRDPKDNKFLELALCGQATSLISGDADLLALNPFHGIPIVTAKQFLDKLCGAGN